MSTTTPHSPEPWTIKRTNEVHYCVWDAEGEIVLNNHPDCDYFPHDLTPERIVACVNACRGVPTEVLAKLELKTILESLDRPSNIDCNYCSVSATIRNMLPPVPAALD